MNHVDGAAHAFEPTALLAASTAALFEGPLALSAQRSSLAKAPPPERPPRLDGRDAIICPHTACLPQPWLHFPQPVLSTATLSTATPSAVRSFRSPRRSTAALLPRLPPPRPPLPWPRLHSRVCHGRPRYGARAPMPRPILPQSPMASPFQDRRCHGRRCHGRPSHSSL